MKTYADNINQTTVMISGLRNNSERAKKRGLDSSFVQGLETDLNEVRNLNNDQESIKAKLKAATDALNKKMESMNKKLDEAKKVVKLEFDKTQWKEFGITDKR